MKAFLAFASRCDLGSGLLVTVSLAHELALAKTSLTVRVRAQV